jgi:hypothetical protein
VSNLGMKITGTELEAGFSAGTREEFDSFVARLTLIADTIWEKQATQAKAGAPIDPSTVEEFERQQRQMISNIKGMVAPRDSVARDWREDQGLR